MVAKQANLSQGGVPARLDSVSGEATSRGNRLGTVTIDVQEKKISRVERGRSGTSWRIPDGWLLAPGLIDLQVNGANGIHLAAEPDRLSELCSALVTTGVTSWLPTLASPTLDEAESLCDAIGKIETGPGGARPIGAHLEGPAISANRLGAHPKERIRTPLETLPYLAVRGVSMVTLAPELDGSDALVDRAIEAGITPSAGHTDATWAEAEEASRIKVATHLFNAMRPIGHRDPGIAAQFLADTRKTVCLICDGLHLAPGAVALSLRAKGWERTAVVTDMVAPTAIEGGPPPPRTSSGRLIGGSATLDRCAANLMEWAGLSLDQALASASYVPAQVIGASDVGRLEPGTRADLVAVDPQLGVGATWIGGSLQWTSPEFEAAAVG